MNLAEEIELLASEGDLPSEIMSKLGLSESEFEDLQPHFATGHAVYRAGIFERLSAGECVKICDILRLQIPKDIVNARSMRDANKRARAEAKAARDDGRGKWTRTPAHRAARSKRRGRIDDIFG